MPYDTQLGERIRRFSAATPGISERKMFGGLCFMVRGNMYAGVVKDELMVRVGADSHDSALARPHVRPMDFTGRPMKGMVFVGPAGLSSDEALGGWLREALRFASSLPPKGSGLPD